VEDLLGEIQQYCLENENEQNVLKYQRYFVEGYDAYGLDPKAMEIQRNLWLQKHAASLGLEGFLQLGSRLVETGRYEEATFAIWFISSFADRYTSQTLPLLGAWLDEGICNWAHTDMFSSDVLPVFLVRGIVPLSAFSAWRNAESKWKRRSVPVTLIKTLDRGVPVNDALQFLEPMMLDGEKVVRQGLGWCLREAWKRSAGQVEEFLLKWKDTCPRLVIQYATEKMSAEQKASFKKVKPPVGG